MEVMVYHSLLSEVPLFSRRTLSFRDQLSLKSPGPTWRMTEKIKKGQWNSRKSNLSFPLCLENGRATIWQTGSDCCTLCGLEGRLEVALILHGRLSVDRKAANQAKSDLCLQKCAHVALSHWQHKTAHLQGQFFLPAPIV